MSIQAPILAKLLILKPLFMSTQTITVNEKEIIIATIDNEKYVAIKPICEALGVNYDSQIEKINSDEILSQLTPLRGLVGADGNKRKMRSISLKFVFGWLFTINPKNVKPEIKQQIIDYRMECYNALFDSFTKRTSILKERTNYQVEIYKLEDELKDVDVYKKLQKLKSSVKNASERLNKLDKNVINDQLDLFKKEE